MKKPLLTLLVLLLVVLPLVRVNSAANANPPLDSDGDGLTDQEELKLGTNPALPDTDGDGLSDGLEVRLGSDPLMVDSDWEGLNDGDEIAFGTDPNNPDTDGDGLDDEDEAYGSFWSNQPVPPLDPTSPDTDGDGIRDDFEFELAKGNHEWDRPYYLYPDWDNDGIIDGLEIYPDDGKYHPTVSPGEIYIDRAVFKGYFCFLNADCDGDGLTDPEELEAGTNVLDPDTDGDGLLDSWEVAYGTDPLSADTDGDGISDLDELRPSIIVSAKLPEEMKAEEFYEKSGRKGYYSWYLEVLVGDGPSGGSSYETVIGRCEWGGYDRETVEKYIVQTKDGQWEFYGIATSPLNPDTDGDGLSDSEESFEVTYITFRNFTFTRTIHLDPTNPDTDGDGIIDSEDAVPLNLDIDDDGVIEQDACAYFEDCDWDGLSDGREIELKTDPKNPDTDGDGLKDFDEVSIWTDPLNPDTDGDGFTDFEEVKAGTDPTDEISHPEAPPAVEKPSYEEVQPEIEEVPRVRVKKSVEFYVNEKRVEPDTFTTIVLDDDEAVFTVKASPRVLVYANGSEREIGVRTIFIYGDDEKRLVDEGDGSYRMELRNFTGLGFDFFSFRVEIDYEDDSSFTYSFNIELKYRAKPEVRLVNYTWLNTLDVGRLYFECRHCKNVTIIVPGALVNGEPKRVIDFGSTRPLKFFYARIIPHRYTVASQSDVGTIYTKYEDSVEVLKTGKDIGLLVAKTVEAKSLGSKIIYGMVATAKGVKTIVGGVEVFIPEEETEKPEGIETPESARFDREAFKKGILDWVKEKIVDATFDYVTEKAIEYADAKELEARRHETTYRVTVKVCNEFYCVPYTFTVQGYGYEFD
ncbi:calcium-binding protein [Thermococcus sp. ES12]|uniref:calcium-binding protein n=1 Tax=Thermococcus sp. ES12 TaxID=1638246 RepID=UPI0014316A37|nr:calcium-binding protein [Thermococcus sp. ES12]NJE75894.1 calcium-binding protein [Thermococcus sp. ES12]